MKKLIYPLLLWIALFSACSSPNQLQSTPSIQVSPSPSMTKTYTPTPTTTATPSRPTDTAAPPSPTPTDTIIPSPTAPPAGILAIHFYPPLVLDYQLDQWIDTSEYGSAGMVPNYLQNKVLKTCTIRTRGASGWYPDDMEEIILGTIHYQALLDQKISPGELMTVYFAENAPKGSIENEVGIPIFEVKSNTTEAKKCRAAAEEVLATLRRADQPK